MSTPRPWARGWWHWVACFFLAMGMGASMVQGQEAADLAQDPVAEKRLMAISAELRCLVCQNESLAASNADLAVDLRREIRRMIQANQSDQQILDFLVERYGDFVRYKPPFKPLTWFLWLGPALLGLGGLIALVRMTRRAKPKASEDAAQKTALSPEQIARANDLLGLPPDPKP